MKKTILFFALFLCTQVQLSAQDTIEIEITSCDSLLETWTNEDMALLKQFILDRPELFERSMNICDQIFVYQNYLEIQTLCDSIANNPGFLDFIDECSKVVAMDSTLAAQLEMSNSLCDSITFCYQNFLLDSLANSACDSLSLREDFGKFAMACDSLFAVDSLAIQRLVGSQDSMMVDSLSALLNRCDTLLYCEAQEQFSEIADSILQEISGLDSINFRNDCDSLIFDRLEANAWTFTEAERIILCNYLLNDLDTTPEEIAEACGITERQLFYLVSRYSKCLRQLGFLTPSILDTGFGSVSIMGRFQESEHGSMSTDLGLSFKPEKNFPQLTFGVTRAYNAERRVSTVATEFQGKGLTTTAPLGQEVNDLGFMLMIDQQFKIHELVNLGYEVRANFMSPKAVIKNNGYAMLTAGLDIDALLSQNLAIDLCGISIELGAFFELGQIDQAGNLKTSKLIPSKIRPSSDWGYNEYGVALNVGFKF